MLTSGPESSSIRRRGPPNSSGLDNRRAREASAPFPQAPASASSFRNKNVHSPKWVDLQRSIAVYDLVSDFPANYHRAGVLGLVTALARPNVSDLPASVFTVEVNGIPTIAFQTKWAADAERIAFAWAAQHSHQIRTRGSHGTELPPVIKVRLARSDERIAIDQGARSEFTKT